MSMHTAQHQYDMQDPSAGGATAEWEASREIVTRCQAELDHDRWLHQLRLDPRTGRYSIPSVWQGMSLRVQQRQERHLRRVHRVMGRHEDIVSRDACPGCGEYSEGGKYHGRQCRREGNAQ